MTEPGLLLFQCSEDIPVFQCAFQRTVHPLMATIFLRMPLSDSLGPDAQFDKPDRQTAETRHPNASKGLPVVGSQHIRQTVFKEGVGEALSGKGGVLVMITPAAQKVATVVIRQRKRVAVLPAQQSELPFKISAPDLINILDSGQRLTIPGRSVFALSVRNHPLAFEDIADSAGSRYGKIDMVIEQPHPQFFGPQSWCF